jgi:hypothetical protein
VYIHNGIKVVGRTIDKMFGGVFLVRFSVLGLAATASVGSPLRNGSERDS